MVVESPELSTVGPQCSVRVESSIHLQREVLMPRSLSLMSSLEGGDGVKCLNVVQLGDAYSLTTGQKSLQWSVGAPARWRQF